MLVHPIKPRIASYSDEHLASILAKRNRYLEEVAEAAIAEAVSRGMLDSAEGVNAKFPLIADDENFAEKLLHQVNQNAQFDKVSQHYLWIGYISVALSILGVFKGYLFAPFLPALYLLGVDRCANQFNRQLYTVLHIVSYVLVFGMVLFVENLF